MMVVIDVYLNCRGDPEERYTDASAVGSGTASVLPTKLGSWSESASWARAVS